MENSTKKIDHHVASTDIQTQEEMSQQFQKYIEQVKNSITNIDINRVTGGMM